MTGNALPLSVAWEEGQLVLLDQTLLPGEVRMLRPRRVEEVFEALQALRVRGAPAIGIAAAYGILVGLDPGSFTAASLARDG